MDRLDEVLTGKEPNKPDQIVNILQIQGGQRYVYSDRLMPVPAVTDAVVRLKMPS